VIQQTPKSVLAFSLSAMLLAGCAVGPTHQPPKVAVDPSFNRATPEIYGTAEPIAQYWMQFNDPLLNRLVAEALASNYDIKLAVARLREARALHHLSKFDRYPTVTTEADFTKSKLSTDQGLGFPSNFLQNELYDANFDAYWELDFFGRVKHSIEAQRAEAQATAYDLHAVQISVTSEVARNYMELRGLQSQLAVAEQNAKNQSSTLELTDARLSAGRGTDFDSERARAQLNSTLATIPTLKALIASDEHRLAVLAGRGPSSFRDELDQVADLPTPPEKIDVSSPEALLRRRPDIAAAERRLAETTALVGVSVADLFPRVVFSGRLGLGVSDFTSIGSSGSSSYSFGPSVTWPAFNLGRVRAQIRASRARDDQALARYQQTVLTAIEETENALVALEQARARRDRLADAALASKHAAELAQIRFEGGLADFLQVLDAQRTQLDAEDRLAQSRTDTATATIALYKALGGGSPPGRVNTSSATPKNPDSPL
jgi:multidrug efflux system outer membrane protein